MVTGPRADDHAVVVGISRYPELTREGVATDLEGPDNDALEVRRWLLDEAGGNLPEENVAMIRSADCTADAEPARTQVERALEQLEVRTRTRTGRRLYLYFSGHGFAPDLEEAALFTAEATQVRPSYVYAHSWLRWFRKAQRFEQSVMWVDACMNYQQSIPVQQVLMRHQVGQAVPGPAFIAVAAQTKSALERRMPDAQVHGVFTWTLLCGLRGGAADRRGRVTGRALQDFLHNAMADFLPDEVRQSASVDLQPFVRADEGLDFVRLSSVPAYDVTLLAPAAVPGQRLRVWTGSPPRVVAEAPIPDAGWQGRLPRGLYVAEVAEAGLRQGFQVTGTGEEVRATVAAPGPGVRDVDAGRLFRIDVRSGNPAASVVLVDHEFQRLYTDTGRLEEREVPGVYKVRTQIGRDLTTASEEVVLLDGDLVLGAEAAPPVLVSAAPLPGSASTDELHTRLFTAAADRDRSRTGTSALTIMSRYWTDPRAGGRPAGLPHPMAGLRLHSPDGVLLADLAEECREVEDDDPVAVWERPLAPGAYGLRQTLPQGIFEGTVVVAPTWSTQVVLRRAVGLGGVWGSRSRPPETLEPDDVAVFMRRPSASAVPERDDVVEAARLALAQGRDLFAEGRGDELRQALLAGYEDPVAGIIGCHLLLRAMAHGRGGGGADPQDTFDRAVRGLGGVRAGEHPDVAALSLRCADRDLRTREPLSAPPVFLDSWRLVVEASYIRPDLVPADLWRRVHASTRIGPFFVWAVDEQRRSAHAHQLQDWVSACRDAEPAPPVVARAVVAEAVRPQSSVAPRMPVHPVAAVPTGVQEAARRVGIPATAAADLWGARPAVPG
ncbi:caspase family protein [Geodermatophilus sp. SYSU D00758]